MIKLYFGLNIEFVDILLCTRSELKWPLSHYVPACLTHLGSLLRSIPTQRMGKNNVMMACIPNPPLDPKKQEAESSPVPLLIRVKTGDDADELLRQIDQHKC